MSRVSKMKKRLVRDNREIKFEIVFPNVGVKARKKNHWKVVLKQVVQATYSSTSILQQH